MASRRNRLWTPASLVAPPGMWFDDTSPLSLSGSDVVQWDDISGNSHHFGQSNSSLRPIAVPGALNGRRVIRFDGIDNVLTPINSSLTYFFFSSVQSGWMMMLIKKSQNDASPTSRRVWLALTSNSTARFGIYNDDATSGSANRIVCGARRLDNGTYQNTRATASNYNTWTAVLAMVDYPGRTIRLYRDGVLDSTLTSAFDGGSTTDSAPGVINMGASTTGGVPWGGDVALALAGIGLPTTGTGNEVDKLFGWAMHGWGLQSQLPIGHPYKSAPP